MGTIKWDTSPVLAQEVGGWVGPSLLFSTPSPTQVIAHASAYSREAHVPSAVLCLRYVQAFSGHEPRCVVHNTQEEPFMLHHRVLCEALDHCGVQMSHTTSQTCMTMLLL